MRLLTYVLLTVGLIAVGVGSSSLFSAIWLQRLEVVGVWVEAVALVLIFGLDFKERKDRRAEHAELQRQAIAQLQTSQDQVEVPQIPFLTYLPPGTGSPGLKNAGFGPAINVRYTATATSGRPNRFSNQIPPPVSGNEGAIAQGDEQRFPTIGVGNLQGNEWEIVIDYESLSGRPYQTKLTLDNDARLTHVAFKRVLQS
ncbi:MAG TPA: hypothetical protein VJN89_02005 [Candidatus Acidoferrum sp.]|nr:hypothetical protein [Candidatus Acidoferrum sp.]